MRFSKKNQPEDVYEWLVIATKKLAPSAQRRVWSEILAHYNEAVAAHQDQGLTEPEAQRAALFELGNVYKAQKDFSRTYLSEREARYLNKLLDRSRFRSYVKTCWLLFFIWAGLPLVFLNAPFSKDHHIFKLTVQFLFAVVVPTALFFVSKGTSARVIIWVRLIAEIFGTLGMLSCINDILGLTRLHGFGFAMWTCMSGFLFDLFVRGRLMRKIPDNPPEPLQN